MVDEWHGKGVTWLAGVLGSTITIGWAVVLSLYIRGRLILGHWPRVYRDDPKSLNLGQHYELATYATASLILCTFVALLLLPGALAIRWGNVGRVWKATMVLACLSLTAIYLGPWVAWIFD
ncbi:MAG: hypothetical protein AAGF92_09405 [Myxococcota bacterium]